MPEASTAAIDFGCIRQAVSEKFTLKNAGRSGTPWALAISGGPFACSATDGVLDGFTSRIANINQELEVTFAPPAVGDYTLTLAISSALTERVIDVIEIALSGSRTADGAVEI